jgi:hypothetical protein
MYGNDPLYLGITWQLIRLAEEAGETPIVLDVTDVLGGLGDAINRRALKLFGIESPDTKFYDLVRKAGYEVLKGSSTFQEGAAFPLSPTAQEGIRETTRSALISYSRDPLPPTSHGLWKKLENELGAAANRSFQSVCGILAARPDIDTVCVLNGRFPYQRAVLEAGLANDKRIMHFEKGEKPDTYWFADHSTLDRVVTQESVDDVLAHLSPDEALSLGKNWMERRSARGSSNIYSRFFAEGNTEISRSSKAKVIGLFSSSQDEFAALGPEWHVQDWQDQLLAFDHVLNHFEKHGFEFYLRVHPNFATKSHASFLREREKIEKLGRDHPSLRIIWHDEQVSSYSLIDETDIVVVWDSTIGLEAYGRGKPVWELAASYYDLYTKIPQWFGHASSPEIKSLEQHIDVERALRFMAYLDIREPDLSVESVHVRDSITPNPSLGLRIANLLSSGGAPRPRIAIRSIADSIRHRRPSINAVAAKKYVGA